MKVFISQAMAGKSDEEVLTKRGEIFAKVKAEHSSAEIIDSFVSLPSSANSIHYLAASLEKMADADLVVFDKEYEKARGCVIEHKVATEYGKKVWVL